MRRIPSSLRGAFVFAALLLLPYAATATVMRYLSLAEHIELSDLVVRARIGQARTFVGENDLPFTDTELEVLEVFKGEVPKDGRLFVRQMKGEVDGLYRAVPGDAQFLPSEEVVLFLRAEEGGVAYLTALGQSKYRVDRPIGTLPGPGDEGVVVVRDLSDVTFYLGGGTPSLTHGEVEAPVDLRIFRETVRDLARETK
jgi:hypothetical protein